MLLVSMNQNKQKNKTNVPDVEKEMDFYVPVGAIVVEFEDNQAGIESKNPNYTIAQFRSALENED